MSPFLDTHRLRAIWSKVQQSVAGLVRIVGKSRTKEREFPSFPNAFKKLVKRHSRLNPHKTSIDSYRYASSVETDDRLVEHWDDIFVEQTDEHLLTKEFEHPEDLFSYHFFETDEHVPPKEFEEPDATCEHGYEDDDHIPPCEVDEYVREDSNYDWWPDDRDDLCDSPFPVSSKTVRQPATDISFQYRQIGGDREITTTWKANMCGAEKTRLTCMAATDDLKGFTKLARLYMGRFREKAAGKYSLNDRLPGDKWSAGGRKLQVALRSMVAGASVMGVPDEAVLFTTIDFAATPELSIWLEAGGAHPNEVFEDGMTRINAALKEVGAEHVMRDGFSEVAQAVNADEDNERCAVYAKAYAREHWPEGLLWDDQSDKVFVPHIHAVFVLLDKDGQPIAAERFAEALRKQFPLPRAVRVETPRDTRWGNPGASVSEKVAAFIRYNIAKGRELTEAEITENIRWHKELQPEHIFFTGWTSFVETRATAVPIMRASLLSRHQLQEELIDFDIGRGHRVEVSIESAVEVVEERGASDVVIRLEDYRSPPSSRAAPTERDMDHEPIAVLPSIGNGEAPIRHHRWRAGMNFTERVKLRDVDRATQRWMILIAANDNDLPVGARAGPGQRPRAA